MTYPCFYYTFTFAALLHIYIVSYEGIPQGRIHKWRVWLTYLTAASATIAPFLHLLSTFFYSVQDSIELTEKLVEDIGILFICYSEFLPGFLTFSEFIELINDMKSKFSTIDSKGIQRLEREEKLWFLKLFVIACIVFTAVETEYLFSASDERVAKRAKIYNHKYAENKVPVNFYVGGLDLSDPRVYYVYMVVMAYFGVSFTGIAALRLPTMGILSIHIKGQLEILIKYIDLIGNQELDDKGHMKFYINIVTGHSGQYFTLDDAHRYKITVRTRLNKSKSLDPGKSLDSRDLPIIRRILECNYLLKELGTGRHGYHNSVYEEYFLKQIIQYHQFLLSIRERAQTYLTHVAIPTCLIMMSLQSLCTYLVLTSEAKFTFCLIWCLLTLHVAQLVQFSEDIEVCNRLIRNKIYATKWYERGRRGRTLVNMVLRRSCKSAQFSIHAGFIVYDRAMLLTLFTYSYRFLNWLLFVHKKT